MTRTTATPSWSTRTTRRWTTSTGEAYFAEAKVTRQRSRDESVETLKNMMASADVDPDIKAEMALKATEIAKSIETEGKIENLIKAKGFEDCMVYYDTDNVDVVVKTEGLEADQVAQMKDIILKETSIPSRTSRSSRSVSPQPESSPKKPAEKQAFSFSFLCGKDCIYGCIFGIL